MCLFSDGLLSAIAFSVTGNSPSDLARKDCRCRSPPLSLYEPSSHQAKEKISGAHCSRGRHMETMRDSRLASGEVPLLLRETSLVRRAS